MSVVGTITQFASRNGLAVPSEAVMHVASTFDGLKIHTKTLEDLLYFSEGPLKDQPVAQQMLRDGPISEVLSQIRLGYERIGESPVVSSSIGEQMRQGANELHTLRGPGAAIDMMNAWKFEIETGYFGQAFASDHTVARDMNFAWPGPFNSFELRPYTLGY